MNKRHAKRWACTHASIILESAMDGGWPLDKGFSDEDTEKVSAAMREIVDELAKRGLREDDEPIQRPVRVLDD